MRVAVVAEWYPSPGDPVLGIWAHRQAVAARDAGAEVRVLALRRPIPPLAVARQLFHIPPAIRCARPLDRGGPDIVPAVRTLDGLSVVTPVPFVAPPRPISYGSWGYWMAPPLARALDRLYARLAVRRAPRPLPGAGGARGGALVDRAARSGPAFVVSAHGPDMINVPENSSVGRRACVAAMAAADLVVANSSVGGAALRGDRGARAAGAGRPSRRRRSARRAPGQRRGPDGHGRAPGGAQAPRGRAPGAGAARPGAPARSTW